MSPQVVIVRAPFALPPVPDGPFVMLDVAFAGGDAVEKTRAFIADAGDRLRLWVDHHEHAQEWPNFKGAPRCFLFGSRIAHACPELVTPELCTQAGAVTHVLAHHDF